MAWSSTYKKKRNASRSSVTWTDNSGAKPAPFAQAIPRYEETRPLPPGYEEHLYVGALWTNTFAMNPDMTEIGKCTFPGLVVMHWQAELATIKLKSMMIYSGIVRVDEREKNGRIVSVPRHTFVVGDGRYIVTDFSQIKPII